MLSPEMSVMKLLSISGIDLSPERLSNSKIYFLWVLRDLKFYTCATENSFRRSQPSPSFP